MGSLSVLILLPCGDLGSGMSQGREQCFVEALVAETAVEAFHEAVLHRLSWRDAVPLDPRMLAPSEDGLLGVNCHRGQFRAVVADNCSRTSALGHGGVEFSRHTQTRKEGVRDQCQALPCEVVHNGQNAELPPIGECITDEVEASPEHVSRFERKKGSEFPEPFDKSGRIWLRGPEDTETCKFLDQGQPAMTVSFCAREPPIMHNYLADRNGPGGCHSAIGQGLAYIPLRRSPHVGRLKAANGFQKPLYWAASWKSTRNLF